MRRTARAFGPTTFADARAPFHPIVEGQFGPQRDVFFHLLCGVAGGSGSASGRSTTCSGCARTPGRSPRGRTAAGSRRRSTRRRRPSSATWSRPGRQPEPGRAGRAGHAPRPEKKVLRASERDRPDAVLRRAEYRAEAAAAAGRRFHVVDECGTTTGVTRPYGRALPGVRVVGAVPHAPWTVTTVIGALGPGGFTVAATLDGPALVAWAEVNLGPALAPGDVAVMDNPGAYKVAGVRAAVEARGAELWFRPAYSPHLNPIEKAWSKVKKSLRDAGARTTEALGAAIERATRPATSDRAGTLQTDLGRALNETCVA